MKRYGLDIVWLITRDAHMYALRREEAMLRNVANIKSALRARLEEHCPCPTCTRRREMQAN
jgi:hypothetical protein